MILNFFSRTVNTSKQPDCPHCGRPKLVRQVSTFAVARKGRGSASDADSATDLPVDESKMESAVNALAAEAEKINEDDPRQAAQLMRKFSQMTGVRFGESMEEALGRLEAGEDPEKIEAEMGEQLEAGEDPFVFPEDAGEKRTVTRRRSDGPRRDPKLYDL